MFISAIVLFFLFFCYCFLSLSALQYICVFALTAFCSFVVSAVLFLFSSEVSLGGLHHSWLADIHL